MYIFIPENDYLLKIIFHFCKSYKINFVAARTFHTTDSYSLELIHSVSKGKVLMPKPFLLNISLHNMQGKEIKCKPQIP